MGVNGKRRFGAGQTKAAIFNVWTPKTSGLEVRAHLQLVSPQTKGAKSVTNDIENALRKIGVWHQGSIAGYRIMYRDTEGYWDGVGWSGVEWSGEHARLFAIREID